MAKIRERGFSYADDVMLERAQVFHDRLTPELADFTARFPWLDAVWLAAFANDITAADAFPKDDSVTLDIRVLTGDVHSAMQQGYAALQALGGYARLAWPKDRRRQRVFGQDRWSASSASTLKLQEALELAYAKADSADLKPALLAKGYTQAAIDQLGALADELQTKNGLQEAAKAGRKVTSQDRIGLLNIVWEHMRTVSICANVVWAHDAGRREQYQLYASSSGGGSGDDGDGLPPDAVLISGTVTSLSGGGPIAGAKVRAYDPALAPTGPSYEVSADAAGSYSLPIAGLAGPMSAMLESWATGFMLQARPILLEPGQEHSGEDFTLSPMAPPPPGP